MSINVNVTRKNKIILKKVFITPPKNPNINKSLFSSRHRIIVDKKVIFSVFKLSCKIKGIISNKKINL